MDFERNNRDKESAEDMANIIKMEILEAYI